MNRPSPNWVFHKQFGFELPIESSNQMVLMPCPASSQARGAEMEAFGLIPISPFPIYGARCLHPGKNHVTAKHRQSDGLLSVKILPISWLHFLVWTKNGYEVFGGGDEKKKIY